MDGETDNSSNRFTEIVSDGKGKTWPGRLNYALTAFTLGIFTLMILAVCLQLLVRWILSPYFGINITWTGALSQLFLVWVTLIGAALASRDNEHIKITFFRNRLGELPRSIFQIVVLLATFMFLIVYAYGSFDQYGSALGRQFHTLPTIPPFTREWFYVIAFIACMLMIGYELRNLGLSWYGERE